MMDPHISISRSIHMNDYSSSGQRKPNEYDDRRSNEAVGVAVGVMKPNVRISSSMNIGDEQEEAKNDPLETGSVTRNHGNDTRNDYDNAQGHAFTPFPKDFRRDDNDGRSGSSMNLHDVHDTNAMKNLPINSMSADFSSNYHDIAQGQQMLSAAPGADNRLMNYSAYSTSGATTDGVESANTRNALLHRPPSASAAAVHMPPPLSEYQFPLKDENHSGDYRQLPLPILPHGNEGKNSIVKTNSSNYDQYLHNENNRSLRHPLLNRQQQQQHGHYHQTTNYGHQNPQVDMAAIQQTQSGKSTPVTYKEQGSYRDFSTHPDPVPDNRRNRGGVVMPFPEKLHQMIEYAEKEGLTRIVSFLPHGRAFAIHKPAQFVAEVMPKFFKQSRFTSFQRQVNLYGFHRISHGPDSGGYYHELFLKGRPGLSINMKRTKIKGMSKGRSDPEKEPNFYHMPPVQKSQARNMTLPMNKEQNNNQHELQPSPSSETGLSMLLPNQDKQGMASQNVAPSTSLKSKQLGDSVATTKNDTLNSSYMPHTEMMNLNHSSFMDPNYGSLSFNATPSPFHHPNNMNPGLWPPHQQNQPQMSNLPPHHNYNATLNGMPMSGLVQPSMNMNAFNIPQNPKEMNQGNGRPMPQMNPFLGENKEKMPTLPIESKENIKAEELQNMSQNTASLGSNPLFGNSSNAGMMPPPMNDYSMNYYGQMDQNFPQGAPVSGMSSNMSNPSMRQQILPQHLSNPYSRISSSPPLSILRQMNKMSGQPPMHLGSQNIGLQLSQQQQHLQNLNHLVPGFDMTPADLNSNQLPNSEAPLASSYGHGMPLGMPSRIPPSNNSATPNPYFLNQPSTQYNIPKNTMPNQQSQTQSEQQQPSNNSLPQDMFQQQASTIFPNKYESYKDNITKNGPNVFKTSFENGTSRESTNYSGKEKEETATKKV